MEKISKTISILIFTILLVIIGDVIWSFFNPVAKLLLLPLSVLSIYYLLLFSFVKLIGNKTSKIWKYIIIIIMIIPLISFAYGYETFIRFSGVIFEQYF